MRRSLVLLIALAAAMPGARAQDREAKSILERHATIRPGADDLAMYRLDWVASLEEAEKRARHDRRPVLLVIIHAKYGDISSGHC